MKPELLDNFLTVVSNANPNELLAFTKTNKGELNSGEIGALMRLTVSLRMAVEQGQSDLGGIVQMGVTYVINNS